MIHGIGIDSVEIKRFHHWHMYSSTQLKRIFSVSEIVYCLESPILSAERFAARFAVREAFFKALYAAYPHVKIPFLTSCKAISIPRQDDGLARLIIDWNYLLIKTEHSIKTPLHPHLSLTHTKLTATALVILEEI